MLLRDVVDDINQRFEVIGDTQRARSSWRAVELILNLILSCLLRVL